MIRFLGNIYDDPIKFTVFSITLLSLTYIFLDKGLLLLGIILLLIKIDSYGSYRNNVSQRGRESELFHLLVNRSKIMAVMKKLKVNKKDADEIFETIYYDYEKNVTLSKGMPPEDFETWKNTKKWKRFLNSLERDEEIERVGESKKISKHEN